MVEFLKKCDVKEETINELIKSQDSSFLFDLNSNEEECINIINYFKEIGIKDIDELLLYESELFFKTIKKIKYAFSKFDIDEFVELINQDYNNISDIYRFL